MTHARKGVFCFIRDHAEHCRDFHFDEVPVDPFVAVLDRVDAGGEGGDATDEVRIVFPACVEIKVVCGYFEEVVGEVAVLDVASPEPVFCGSGGERIDVNASEPVFVRMSEFGPDLIAVECHDPPVCHF